MAVDVSKQMDAILTQFNKGVKDTTNEAITSVSKESVQKLKNTSPRQTGDYAKSWHVKKQKNGNGIEGAVVHNKDHYRLTHLLENGHVIRNKKGTYGRTRGIKHIAPVEEWANGELVEVIERNIEHGNL